MQAMCTGDIKGQLRCRFFSLIANELDLSKVVHENTEASGGSKRDALET